MSHYSNHGNAKKDEVKKKNIAIYEINYIKRMLKLL